MNKAPWTDTSIGDPAGFDIADEAALAAAVAHLAREVQHTLYVYSADLEPRIYDTAPFIEAIRQTATASRRADIRFLVRDIDPALKAGHRLIELARQLTSFIGIRVAPARGDLKSDAFVIADQRAVLFRALAARPEGDLQMNDPRTAVVLSSRFHNLWEEGAAVPDLRRLHL